MFTLCNPKSKIRHPSTLLRASLPSAIALALLIVLTFGLAAPRPALAATLTVDTLLDENDGSCSDGDCSLRDAIQTAAAGDTITFSVSGTITLTFDQLYIAKDLTLSGPGQENLTVSGNNASRVFNITAGNVTLSGLTIANGSADNGGGLYNSSTGNVTLTDVTFRSNLASLSGGGVYNSGDPTLTNITFSDNLVSSYFGGGMYNSGSPTLTNVTFSGNVAHVGGGMYSSGNPVLTRVTFSNNSAFIGGGMSNNGGGSALTDVTFNNNSADTGGGMHDSGSSTLTNVTFSGNLAGSYGGGISTGGGSTLTNVTFNGNSTYSSGGGMGSSGDITVANVTFSGNFAKNGGGMYISSGNPMLTNVTFSSNSASSNGGGMYNYTGTVSLKNIILAGNTATTGPDCYGTINSFGYNLIQDTGGCTIIGDETGNLYGVDPLLGPLQDNGGDTLTHALLPGSPAIDAADFTDPYGNPVIEDQRGVARPQGPANDIGAYEAEILLTLHVHDITLSLRGTKVTGMVTVYDNTGQPVEMAIVSIEVSGPIPPRSLTRPTDVNGRVRFAGPARPGAWQLCVTDIVKEGYLYDPTQNVETCDTITVP